MTESFEAWAPQTVDVARVVPWATRQGFDDDQVDAGAEQGEFTDATTPTAEHVAGLITAACQEITGRVGVVIPERCRELAWSTAVWHVAAQITADREPAGVDEAVGAYRGFIASYRACLDELVVQARMPGALRVG